jgi:hypothetical protein
MNMRAFAAQAAATMPAPSSPAGSDWSSRAPSARSAAERITSARRLDHSAVALLRFARVSCIDRGALARSWVLWIAERTDACAIVGERRWDIRRHLLLLVAMCHALAPL